MEPLALSDELVNSPDDVSWKKSTLTAPQGQLKLEGLALSRQPLGN